MKKDEGNRTSLQSNYMRWIWLVVLVNNGDKWEIPLQEALGGICYTFCLAQSTAFEVLISPWKWLEGRMLAPCGVFQLLLAPLSWALLCSISRIASSLLVSSISSADYNLPSSGLVLSWFDGRMLSCAFLLIVIPMLSYWTASDSLAATVPRVCERFVVCKPTCGCDCHQCC